MSGFELAARNQRTLERDGYYPNPNRRPIVSDLSLFRYIGQLVLLLADISAISSNPVMYNPFLCRERFGAYFTLLCHVYLKWRQSRSWGRPECFQTAPISFLSPKLSNDGLYMSVPYQDPTLPTGSWNNMGYIHYPPKNHVPNRKTTRFHRSSRLTAGPAASIRPPGPHPLWTRTRWCCRPHGGPRELQSWQAWASGLEPKIHLPRQAHTMRSPSPP